MFLNRRRNTDINDLETIKELSREYSRIQMKIKYYNNYQKLYQRNKKLNE